MEVMRNSFSPDGSVLGKLILGSEVSFSGAFLPFLFLEGPPGEPGEKAADTLAK